MWTLVVPIVVMAGGVATLIGMDQLRKSAERDQIQYHPYRRAKETPSP